MIREVKKISLIFENTEYADIDAEHIKRINIEVGKDEIIRTAVNSIERIQTINYLEMLISKEADIVITDTLYKPETLFKRLFHEDITHVEIVYENDEKEEFCVPWTPSPSNENINSLQIVQKYNMYNDKGNLLLTILPKDDGD